ncbi:MAG: class I SAM-dependent rRNA methyltransferase [Desulfotomaculales bacterium]
MKARLVPGRPREERRLHPWIYRGEIAEIAGQPVPGDVLDVVDARGRFVGRGYWNPASQIAIRILSRDEGEAIDRDFFYRRLNIAIAYRAVVVEDTDACRLVNAEADFLPGLIVDRYGEYLVVQTLTLGIEKYKETIVGLLVELLSPTGIYERNDASVRELEGLPLRKGVLHGACPPEVSFAEYGLSFWADILNGQKTGFFLDQRENRRAVARYARGKRVLDCFCYAGGFAVHAAAAGAAEVVAVDISADALGWAARHAAANGVAGRCRFVEANAVDYLRARAKAGEVVDLVLLDPPCCTKAKEAVPGAVRGYKEINLRALKLLKPGGYLATCSCSYHITENLFLAVVGAAARDARRELRLVELRRQAKDHPMLLAAPETYYLKCAILQVF